MAETQLSLPNITDSCALFSSSSPVQLGFFKRVRPPQEDCIEKEQLQPEENGNTDA